jgi:O-antigen ligase
LIILTSLSRTTSAIALLFLVPLSFAKATGRKAWLSLLATPILGVTLVGFLLLWGPIRARFLGEGVGMAEAGDLQSDYAELDTSGRNEMWAATYLSALQKPILGHGTGTASELVQIMVPGLEHPHNDYLRIFHDQGLVGLGLFLWAWWGRVLYHWKTWRSSETVQPLVSKYRLIGLLVAVSISLSFLTDNLMLYEYMMMPSLLLFSMSDFLEYRLSLPTRPSTEAAHGSYGDRDSLSYGELENFA